MWYSEHGVVIRTWQQVVYSTFYPFLFFECPTKATVPIATAMVLQLPMPTIGVIALIAVIAQVIRMTLKNA